MKFAGLASLMLAACLSANASAGFLLLDDFDDSNTATGFELGRATVDIGGSTVYGDINSGTLSVGQNAFSNAVVTYGGLNSFDFGYRTKFVLTDFATTGGPVLVSSFVNGSAAGTNSMVGSDLVFDLTGFVGSVDTLQFRFTSDTSPFTISASSLQAVPEPATMALIGMIGAGGGVASWRKRRKAASA
ncbi:PEP-CTERM sorting domain-containing protein [Planctomycetaceae bacterium SH139]